VRSESRSSPTASTTAIRRMTERAVLTGRERYHG
jgi:hypothetical protein